MGFLLNFWGTASDCELVSGKGGKGNHCAEVKACCTPCAGVFAVCSLHCEAVCVQGCRGICSVHWSEALLSPACSSKDCRCKVTAPTGGQPYTLHTA